MEYEFCRVLLSCLCRGCWGATWSGQGMVRGMLGLYILGPVLGPYPLAYHLGCIVETTTFTAVSLEYPWVYRMYLRGI